MSDDKKKLYRSADDRWLAGVCGGIAEYFDVDSTLIRVLFILFGFAVGGGLLIYIILWIIMPNAPAEGEMADFEIVEEDEAVDEEQPADSEAEED